MPDLRWVSRSNLPLSLVRLKNDKIAIWREENAPKVHRAVTPLNQSPRSVGVSKGDRCLFPKRNSSSISFFIYLILTPLQSMYKYIGNKEVVPTPVEGATSVHTIRVRVGDEIRPWEASWRAQKNPWSISR